MRPDFNIVVIGGGMVGAATAALLAATPGLQQASIALVEDRPPTRPPEDGIDIRVSALSRASERILRAVGAWSELPQDKLCAYEDMVVWDAASGRAERDRLHFSAGETSEPNLGYIVENRRVQWALYGAPALRQRVSLQRAQLAEVDLTEMPQITLSDGRRLQAGLIVAADGAASKTRELAQLPIVEKQYPQSAFVTHVRTEQPHARTAYQRFLPNGPIALLPLPDGQSSIVWTTTPEHARSLCEMPVEQCNAEITAACDRVIGSVEVTADRAQFPLKLAHARAYCRRGLVLVGDAAHAVHPLAGQGVNLGFLDAAALAQVLGESVQSHGLDCIGDLAALRRYERWRKSENTIALSLIDGLNALFSNENNVLGWARRSGFSLVNRSSVAKRTLIQRAMGIAGDLPQVVKRAAF